MLTYFFNLKQPQSPLQNTKNPTKQQKTADFCGF